MDTILDTILSWQFIIFGVAVSAVMFVIRTIVEYIMSACKMAVKDSKLWNELFLPILPVIIGTVGAFFFKTYPYPDGLTTNGDRIIFGLVAGLLSTLIYRIGKALLIKKIEALEATIPANLSDPGNKQ